MLFAWRRALQRSKALVLCKRQRADAALPGRRSARVLTVPRSRSCHHAQAPAASDCACDRSAGRSLVGRCRGHSAWARLPLVGSDHEAVGSSDFGVAVIKRNGCVGLCLGARSVHGRVQQAKDDQKSQFTNTAFGGTLTVNDVKTCSDGHSRRMASVFIKRLGQSMKYEDICLVAR